MIDLNEHGLELLQEMLRIRRFEEAAAEQYSAGNIRGFLHLYVGEEAVAVGVIRELGREDAIVSTYREHGHALARGMTARSIMAEMFGKLEGCARGRGGSMHLFDAATRFYGGNAIVAGALPVAVGLALGDKMLGRERVTVCFFGDGAVAEGEFHESLNLASLWKLPVLFACENNQYAMGTALARSEAEIDLAAKARSYHLRAEAVDGMDLLAVNAVTAAALRRIRAGEGPEFIEYQTYRFRAHSMFDAQLYRSKDEVERWREQDPIARFQAQLRERGLLDDEALAQIEREIADEIADAIDYAAAGTLEPIADLTRFVYSDPAAREVPR
jgi:pyruvate dehydrogenase E1 component alpha subunit